MDNQQNNNQPQGGENGNQGNNGKFPEKPAFHRADRGLYYLCHRGIHAGLYDGQEPEGNYLR